MAPEGPRERPVARMTLPSSRPGAGWSQTIDFPGSPDYRALRMTGDVSMRIVRTALVPVMALLVCASLAGPSVAANVVKAGATCKQAGQKVTKSGQTFTCTRKSGKLVWVAKAASKPTPKPTATSTPKPATAKDPIVARSKGRLSIDVERAGERWVQTTTTEFGLSSSTLVHRQRVRVTLRQETRPNLGPCIGEIGGYVIPITVVSVWKDGTVAALAYTMDGAGKATITGPKAPLMLILDESLTSYPTCATGEEVDTYTYDGLATAYVTASFTGVPWGGFQTYATPQPESGPYVGTINATFSFTGTGDAITVVAPKP